MDSSREGILWFVSVKEPVHELTRPHGFSPDRASRARGEEPVGPGGLFAFATATPIQMLCLDMERDEVGRTLINDYFGMKRFEWDDEVDFQVPYGEWIRRFRQSGFIVQDLIETRPPEGSTSSYRTAEETEWAQRWPMENIWRERKKMW